MFWDRINKSKVKGIENKLFDNIHRSFLDTDDNIVYIVSDVVRPSKISKTKKGLYYKYFSKDKFDVETPENENDYEYTEVNLFLNAKWVKWKSRIKNIKTQPHQEAGYKYALVVVDDHSRKCDAEPLKDRDSLTVANGLKKIFSRGIVQKPKDTLEVDDGNEFKGITDKEINDDGVRITRALPNRHRSQGLVEAKNKTIGSIIHKLQAINELETKTYNNSWVKELPSIIKIINANLPKPIDMQSSNEPYSSKYNKDLLPIKTEVRVSLDYPEDLVNHKRIDNKFRNSDIRFSRNIYKIKNIIIKPSFPPMYLVGDDIETARTRNQLQVVKHQQFV